MSAEADIAQLARAAASIRTAMTTMDLVRCLVVTPRAMEAAGRIPDSLQTALMIDPSG
jgi:hypothetical protein